MATSAVGGGAIDVASLVSQLMSIERRPLDKLQSQEAAIQSKLSAYGRLQSAFDALESATAKLAAAEQFRQTAVKVNGEGIAAAGTGSGVAGRYVVSVSALARAQSTASQFLDPATVLQAGTLNITQAGTTASISVGGVDQPTTLAGLRDAINAREDLGVQASLVSNGSQVSLVLNSRTTGAASAFTVGVSGSLAALTLTQRQAAQDAAFSVNGLALTSGTNQIAGVIDGVTLSLTRAPAQGSTVDAEVVVDRDGEGIRGAVDSFVKAYNEAQKLIAELSKYDPVTRTSAVLNSESLLRQLQAGLRGIVGGAMTPATAGDYTRLSQIGIETQADGTLALNASRFDAALAADAGKVSRLFTTATGPDNQLGFGQRLLSQIKLMADPSGALDRRQEALRDSIKRLDQRQDQLQARLALTEQRLTRQYSALDALLSARQQQSNALANALAGLPTVTK